MSPALLAALAVVPFLVGIAAFGLCGPIADRMAPAMASALLTALALTVALATGLLLCLSAMIASIELLPGIALDHWSGAQLRRNIPLPPAVGAIAGCVAAALVGSAAVHAVRVLVRVRRASIAAGAMLPAGGDLVVVRDESAQAYAISGRHQRIVVSTGMLNRLTATQRRALLAHEAAHLRYHHQVYVQLGRLAAAANPLMRPVASCIDLAVERWADESAARAVGDRHAVAHTLAAAALTPSSSPMDALAGAQNNVLDRVRVLLAPPPVRRTAGAAVAGCVAVCWLAAVVVISRVHTVMELAEQVRGR